MADISNPFRGSPSSQNEILRRLQAPANSAQVLGPSFADRFSSSNKLQFLGTAQGQIDHVQQQLNDQAKLLESVGIRPNFNLGDVDIGGEVRPGKARKEDVYKLLDQYAAEFPELGLKTSGEIEDKLIEDYKRARYEDQILGEEDGILGGIAMILGAATGFLRDPRNLITTLVGGGAAAGAVNASKPILGQILRNEFIAGLGIAGAAKPPEVDIRRRSGEDVGLAKAAGEVVAEAAIGATIAGGVAVAAGAIAGRVSRQSLGQQIEHLNAVKPEGVSNAEYSDNVVRAAEQMVNGEKVSVVDEAVAPSASRSQVDEPLADVTDETLETDLASLREELEGLDADVVVEDLDGNIVSAGTIQERLRQSDLDLEAADKLVQCGKKRAGGVDGN